MASPRHPPGAGVHDTSTYFTQVLDAWWDSKETDRLATKRKAAAAKDPSFDAADPKYRVLPRPNGLGGIPDFWMPWLTSGPLSLVKHELLSNDTNSEGVSTDPAPASASRRQIATKKHLQRSSAVHGQPSVGAIGGAKSTKVRSEASADLVVDPFQEARQHDYSALALKAQQAEIARLHLVMEACGKIGLDQPGVSAMYMKSLQALSDLPSASAVISAPPPTPPTATVQGEITEVCAGFLCLNSLHAGTIDSKDTIGIARKVHWEVAAPACGRKCVCVCVCVCV